MKASLVYITPSGQWKTKKFNSVASARKYGLKVKKQKNYLVSSIRTCHKTENGGCYVKHRAVR